MGRPLFSKAFQSDPVVREPESPCPYEKWSYINAFDPDSDEFFENDQAVYEAFVDPVAAEHSEDEEEMEERDMVVIRMGNASPISSEDSLSDPDSPMAVGADDPAQYIAQAYRRQRAEAEAPVRVRLATPSISGDVQRDTSVSRDSGLINSSRDNVAILDEPASALQAHPASHDGHLELRDQFPLPPPSEPIPVPGTRSQHSASVEGLSFSSFYHQSLPLTPPSHTSFTRFSPSPPPTVSPRLYTWASRRQAYSSTGTSPFINTNARLSHTHISPVLIRARDVMA